MDDEPIAAFRHRPNADGSHDSICLTCFATVCSAGREADLGSASKAIVAVVGSPKGSKFIIYSVGHTGTSESASCRTWQLQQRFDCKQNLYKSAPFIEIETRRQIGFGDVHSWRRGS
jgi:hypothetical protein